MEANVKFLVALCVVILVLVTAMPLVWFPNGCS